MSTPSPATESTNENLGAFSSTKIVEGGKRSFFDVVIREYGALIGMFAVLGIFGILEPGVLKPENLGNVLEQSAALAIMATGFSIAMMVRGVDLSVAQVADAAGLLAAYFLVHGQPLWLVFIAPVLFGLLIGSINGMLMAYLGVPALIGTLGMMFVVRSFELVLSHGREAQVLFALDPARTKAFFFLGQGSIGPVSFTVVLAALVVGAAYLITARSNLGRYFDAIGGNVRAALLAGVRHRIVFAMAFLISGVLAAVAGMVLTSRAALAAPGAVVPFLLDAFVAVYLGSLIGRRGTINIVGTAIGSIFVGLVGNALTLMGAGVAVRYLAYGVIVLAAMTVGSFRRQS
jgi:ribose/xylose/arabinose/galactoside ABC-type transport system permease subunit